MAAQLELGLDTFGDVTVDLQGRPVPPAQVLRARVTSPGGTTQAAIEAFQAGGFEALVDRAIHAAASRGRQLSAQND